MIEHVIKSTLAPIWDEIKEQHELVTTYGLRLDILIARVEVHERLKVVRLS